MKKEAYFGDLPKDYSKRTMKQFSDLLDAAKPHQKADLAAEIIQQIQLVNAKFYRKQKRPFGKVFILRGIWKMKGSLA
jgi:hypothetical protein